jgi:hypothetical protein
MESNKNFTTFSSFLEENCFYIVFLLATILWGLSGLFKNVILLGLAIFLIFSAIILNYRKNQVGSIVLLCFAVLFIFITLWYVESQPLYLTVGVTSVMVITTTWYSSNMLRQVRIAENSGKKNYIAEIARSIFSSMQLDLLNARRSITEGPFFTGLLPLKTTIDRVSPLFYLQGDVEIRGKPLLYGLSTDRSIIGNGRGPHRPARVLLTVPDDKLQKNLPVITELCKKFEEEHKKIDFFLNSLIQKSPLFWEDFKSYCDSLDKYELKGVFISRNGQSPNETYYHYLLRYALTQGNPDVEHYQVIDDGIRLVGKQQEFLNYLRENRVLLLDWLIKSPVGIEVREIRTTLENLVSLIDQTNDQINELFLAWKVQYGLTEDEMNLKVMCW